MQTVSIPSSQGHGHVYKSSQSNSSIHRLYSDTPNPCSYIYRNQQRQATLVLMLFILQTLGLVVHLDATGYSRIQGDHSTIVIATQGSNVLLIR